MEVLDDLISCYPNWNATEIDGKMRKELKDRTDLPTLRTVQNYVRENRPSDPTGPWEPTEWAGEDVAPVLDVLKLLRQTGEAYWPTRAEAERVLWVRRIAPAMGLDLVWRFARRYVLYEARKVATERLGWFLAFRPWESSENEDAYFKAVPPDQRVMFPVEGTGSMTGGGGMKAKGEVVHK
jgi:hypothetical protein